MEAAGRDTLESAAAADSAGAAVSNCLRRGLEQNRGLMERIFTDVGEFGLVAIEVVLAVAILRLTDFHPLAVLAVAAWAFLRTFGFWRRYRIARRSRALLREGLAALEAGDYAAAASNLGESFRISHREEAGIGYVYSAGKVGDMREMLRGARALFRVNLYHSSADEILEKRGCRALLSDPDFRAVRPRLRAILVGEEEELVHLVPQILQGRAVQVLVGLVMFTLLAFVFTALLTFL